MKTTFFFAIMLLSTMKLFSQHDHFKLPKEWDKTFVISVSHTGSMSGGSSHLTFTYDSCKYLANSMHGKPDKKVFALSQRDRDIILAKMRELKVDRVKVGLGIAAQHDGWSDLLCIGAHCIEGGSASRMNEKDKDTFLTACGFLEDFISNR